MMLRQVAALCMACFCGALWGADPSSAPLRPPMTDIRRLGPGASVGHVRLAADEVFELWTPIWYETQAKVRNNKLGIEEGDRLLHEEWQRAVYSLIKDELFFQEAEREYNSTVNNIVDRLMRAGADRPRNQMTSEVRRLMSQDMERWFRIISSERIKQAGGRVKLYKVLEGRGLTFMEWQNRVKKKAFTESFMRSILQPKVPGPGPRQVQKYYQDNPEEFSLPGTVRFRHIFFSNALRGEEQARNDAVEVWERLEDGEIDFESAAARYSDDAESKARGGLETEEEAADAEREAWLADIRTALREESPDELGPILESPFGCHVTMLISVGPTRKQPFSEVQRAITQKLTAKDWEEETDRYFRTIRRNTEIIVHQRDFPPHLSCAAQFGLPAGGPRVYQTYQPGVVSPQSRRGGAR